MIIIKLYTFHILFDKLSEIIEGYIANYTNTDSEIDTIKIFKEININQDSIDLSEDNITEIYNISEMNVSKDYVCLVYNMNKLKKLVFECNKDINIIKNSQLNEENLRLFQKIISTMKGINIFSKEIMKDINEFLSDFINGKNFPEKNIQITLPKADGSIETIKRTVP